MPTQARTAKEKTLLYKLEKAAREKQLKKNSEESYKWFMTKAKFVGADNARETLLKDGDATNTIGTTLETGKVYTYRYEAKYADELPYWDAFPLIIAVGPAKGGFYGCNLHYLNPRHRAVIFDKLMSITSNKRYDKSTRILLSYQLMQATAKLDLLKPCFKRYLFNYMRSPFVEIPASQWQAALFLPTQDFQKANQSTVWSNSLKGL